MQTFGRTMLEHWLLDPHITYLNHGTVGAPPARVLRTQQALRDEMERQPSRFLLRELHGRQAAPWRTTSRLREAASAIALFVGARADDLVFVSSVSTGLNAVLRSMPLEPGDEVLVSDFAYGAVAIAAAAAADARGAIVRTIAMPFPLSDPGETVQAFVGGITTRTRLALVDHVTAGTALVLPVAEIAAECRKRGVPVVVDGAHAPGSVPLDIPALGVEWYAANLHKWAMAPRPCGILWAAPDRQAHLRHPVASWGTGKGYLKEFENVATNDPTSFLAAPDAIALLQEWDFGRVLAHNHALAWEAAELLTARWNTTIPAPRSMVGSMVTVPLPEAAGSTPVDAERLRLALLVDDSIEVQIHAWRGRLWARVATQVYNERADIERLAQAVERRVLQTA